MAVDPAGQSARRWIAVRRRNLAAVVAPHHGRASGASGGRRDAPPGLPRVPPPAEPFDLLLEGRYQLSFCDRRWPLRWEACPTDPADLAASAAAPAPRLVFEPRYVRTDLGEETVASGVALLALPAAEVPRGRPLTLRIQRRVYGTTGAPILLDFQADGHPMGSEYAAGADVQRRGPRFHVRGVGVAALEAVELVRDGRVIAAWPGAGMAGEFEYADRGWEDAASAKGWAYYYARVRQTDGR